MRHAFERAEERFGGVCPRRLISMIRAAYHRGALTYVCDNLIEGRKVYRFTHADLPEPVYPLIARDGYIVTVFLREHLIHTPRGRLRIADIEEGLS